MYKMQTGDSVFRVSDKTTIPKAPGNRDYNQFVEDIKEHGPDIVEGADVIEPDYIALRSGPDGYASVKVQLEVLTEEGLEAFQALNMAVKAKFPKTIKGGKNIAPLPDWIIGIE